MKRPRYTPAHKPVHRETTTVVRDRKRLRPLIVTLAPEGVIYRLKGTRKRLTVPHLTGYSVGARLEGDRIRAERRANRKRA